MVVSQKKKTFQKELEDALERIVVSPRDPLLEERGWIVSHPA